MNHDTQRIQQEGRIVQESAEAAVERGQPGESADRAGEEKRTREIKNFWKKVTTGPECWQWHGSKNSDGYGHFWWQRRVIGSHRVSWMIHFGDIPPGQQVLHRCDNPECTNPDHLFLGTQEENIRDMVQKKRHSHGEAHRAISKKGGTQWCARLTVQDVLAIRAEYADGVSQRTLGMIYGVGQTQISKIVLRKKWKHV